MTQFNETLIHIGIDLSAGLIVERAERNRLVIFDPSSVHLLRPVILAEDVRPWFCAANDRWAIVIPPGYAADSTLQARHQALGRHMVAVGLDQPAEWETDLPLLPPGPQIILAPDGAAAWHDGNAMVAAPALMLAAAQPHWLAFLNSSYGQAYRSRDGLTRLTIPELPAPQRANLDGMVLSLVSLYQQRAELERAVVGRLLADFAPPGVGPSARLERWWELTFDGLREEVVAALQNDIPARFRTTWQQIHNDQRTVRSAATARIDALAAALETQVAAVVGGS